MSTGRSVPGSFYLQQFDNTDNDDRRISNQETRTLERPWQREVEDILNGFDVDPGQGLSSNEVKDQRKRYGRNCIQSKEYKSACVISLEQEEISGGEVIELLGIKTDSRQASKLEKSGCLEKISTKGVDSK